MKKKKKNMTEQEKALERLRKSMPCPTGTKVFVDKKKQQNKKKCILMFFFFRRFYFLTVSQ